MAHTLWQSVDPAEWRERAHEYKALALTITGERKLGGRITHSETKLQAISDALRAGTQSSLSRDDLLVLNDWKYTRNKWRPAWKLAEKNSEAAVRDATRAAFAQIAAGDWRAGHKSASALFGVGPAFASIFLALASDDHPFFGEEAVSASGARDPRGDGATYTLAKYLSFHTVMAEKAAALNARLDAGAERLTPVELERALFAAERSPASSAARSQASSAARPPAPLIAPGGGTAAAKRQRVRR